MPRTDFGEKIFTGQKQGQFIKLEKQGESITFRIANVPAYDGKHWIDKIMSYCPKIMKQDVESKCQFCEKANSSQDAEEKRKYKVKVNFYFPILNKETRQAQIFQTGLSVRNAIEDYQKNGIDVYKSDWKVVRNEGDDPARYYLTIRLDTTKLTKEEEEALGEAAGFDLEKMTSKSFPKKEEENFIDEVSKEIE